MKLLFPFILFFISSFSSLFAKETAFSAIQALRDAGRPELVTGLAEIKGEHGEPQPEEWTVLCNDPSARGGIRELTIKDHHIIAERTPLRSFEGEGNLPQFNLPLIVIDSNAVFAAANQEAVARRRGFDFINYTLRVDAITGNPIWIVQLYKPGKEADRLIGTLQFSAETGTMLKGF